MGLISTCNNPYPNKNANNAYTSDIQPKLKPRKCTSPSYLKVPIFSADHFGACFISISCSWTKI